MEKQNPIFEKHYHDYLESLAKVDIPKKSLILDISVEENGKTAVIPFFGHKYRVSHEGISDDFGNRPNYDICLLLLKYLLLCPKQLPSEDNWVNYRDLKDSGPLAVYFNDNVISALSKKYSGRKIVLEDAAAALGGTAPSTDYPYDVAVVFRPLPRVPILILFNDADDEFPAQTTVLFEQRAEQFLDAECLAMLAVALLKNLKQKEKALKA